MDACPVSSAGVLLVVFACLQTTCFQAVAQSSHTSLQNESDAALLMETLLNRSDSRVRPNIYGDAVTVYCDFFVASFGSINAVDMDFMIDVFFRQRWTDHRLIYSEREGPVIIPPNVMDRIWLPDLYFPNEKKADFHDVMVPNKAMKIFANGTVRYSARLTLRLSCPMVLTHFPMDYQNCFIKVSSYTYEEHDVKLVWLDKADPVEMNLDDLSLPQFELTDTTTDECAELYKTGSFSCLRVIFHLRREFGFYLLQSYIPCILIVILSWLSFWINKEAVPARITLGVTTVLTMVTQLSSSRGASMTVSYAKAIDVWFAFCMILVFGALLEFALVNVLTRRDTKWRRRTILARHRVSDEHITENNIMEMQSMDEESPEHIMPKQNALIQAMEKYLRLDPKKFNAESIDKTSRIIFPAAFALFNLLYWIIYTQPIVFSALH